MNFSQLYKKELANEDTRFFIFDTKGANTKHGDADFEKYLWQLDQFGKVRAGDLFLYRRPKKASETKLFYFFGAGKVGTIENLEPVEDQRVEATVISPYPFTENVDQIELEYFEWEFKKRTPGTWANFFNQYGMNRITKGDFLSILQIAESNSCSDYDNVSAAEAVKSMQKEDFFVDDEKGQASKRSKQTAFSNKVKNNYQNKCGLCGINTRSLLVGSHIIPWAKDKRYRLDPANGLSLCIMHDKLFDQGLITLDTNLKVQVSPQVAKDKVLEKTLSGLAGKKLHKPRNSPPNQKYLDYHRDNIFKS